MQQRPSVNFWRLLAATILVDVVILSSANIMGRSDSHEAFSYGAVFGQLCTVCIWCVFSTHRAAARWTVIGVAIVAAAAATLTIDHMPITDALGLSAAVAALMLLALWSYRLVLTLRNRSAAATTQFSMKDLFVLTTASALLAGILRGSEMMQGLPLFVTSFILTNAIVAVACLVFWSRSWHALLRLGATLAVAIASGWCLTTLRPHLVGELEVMFCIQSLTIFLWLEIGDIIPRYRAPSDADAEEATINAVK